MSWLTPAVTPHSYIWPRGEARRVISSFRPGLAESSSKGHSIDCDKDDMDMEGRVFERLCGQMYRNYASTRSAAAAIFSLPSVTARLIIPRFPSLEN